MGKVWPNLKKRLKIWPTRTQPEASLLLETQTRPIVVYGITRVFKGKNIFGWGLIKSAKLI